MAERKRLPNRRNTELLELHFRGQNFTVAFSRHVDDNNPAEVFIDAHKLATDVSSDARDIAVLLSIAIQHGVPLRQMADAVCRLEEGEPAGLAGAVLDVLLNESERPEEITEQQHIDTESPSSPVSEARMRGYTGEACTQCNNYTMKRNGACLVCDICGANTGCS